MAVQEYGSHYVGEEQVMVLCLDCKPRDEEEEVVEENHRPAAERALEMDFD